MSIKLSKNSSYTVSASESSIQMLVWGLHFLLVYNLLFWLIGSPQSPNLAKILVSIFLVVSSICFLLSGFLALYNGNLLYFKRYEIYIIFLMMLWGIIIILRSLSIDRQVLFNLFGSVYGGWVWLVPIVLITVVSKDKWLIILKVATFHALIGIVLSIPVFMINYRNNIMDGFTPLHHFFYGIPYLLLTFNEHTIKTKIVIIFGYFVSLSHYFIRFDRVTVFLLVVVFLFFIPFYYAKGSFIKKLYMSLLTMVFIALLFTTITQNSIFQDRYTYWSDRVYIDTRTFMFEELFNDLDTKDLIFGRGALGTYYSSWFNFWFLVSGEIADHYQRPNIEIAYMHYILKGGLILLILYLLLFAQSGLRGLVSKDPFIRRAALLISIYIILYAIKYTPQVSTQYIFFWLLLGFSLKSKDVSYRKAYLHDL